MVHRSDELLRALGLSKLRRKKTAQALASRPLLGSVGVVHLLSSKALTVVSSSFTIKS